MRARSLAFGAALAVASTTVPTVANAGTPAPITSPGQTAPQQSAPSATSFRTTARTPSGGTALLGRSCTGFASNVTPPRTIRVYRTAYGRVDVVNFNTYVKNSLPREWITSWKTESLKAGAMAVKTYAWYRTLHWKGGSAGGVCYDLRDDTADQVYRPGSALAVTNAAVDAT